MSFIETFLIMVSDLSIALFIINIVRLFYILVWILVIALMIASLAKCCLFVNNVNTLADEQRHKQPL